MPAGTMALVAVVAGMELARRTEERLKALAARGMKLMMIDKLEIGDERGRIKVEMMLNVKRQHGTT